MVCLAAPALPCQPPPRRTPGALGQAGRMRSGCRCRTPLDPEVVVTRVAGAESARLAPLSPMPWQPARFVWQNAVAEPSQSDFSLPISKS